MEEQDAEGRLDVLIYRSAERLTKKAEDRYQLQGLWDELGDYVEDFVEEYVGDEKVIELTPLMKSLLVKAGVRL